MGGTCGTLRKKGNAYGLRPGNLNERYSLGNSGLYWRIILKY
jgi:hypothetical protein